MKRVSRDLNTPRMHLQPELCIEPGWRSLQRFSDF